MKGTGWYLDALRAHFGINSDYALAKRLGIAQSRISNYRCGRATFDDEMAFKIADILTVPRSEVWLAIQAERARKSHNEALYDTLADALHRMGGLAA